MTARECARLPGWRRCYLMTPVIVLLATNIGWGACSMNRCPHCSNNSNPKRGRIDFTQFRSFGERGPMAFREAVPDLVRNLDSDDPIGVHSNPLSRWGKNRPGVRTRSFRP